VTAFGPQRWL